MKVAVIGGGTSPEQEVSRRSAKEVIDALNVNHDALYIEFDFGLNHNLLHVKPDVVFPVLHGIPGEDGAIQGYLESIGMPFVGSGLSSSALAIDKFSAKCVWGEAGLPVLPMKLLYKNSFTASLCTEIISEVGDRIAVKPREQGSALGVNLLPDGGDVENAIRQAFTHADSVIVEPYKHGHEITVGVLDTLASGCESLPVIEIQVLKKDGWYDFTNRYEVGASRHVIDPDLPTGINSKLQQYAVEAHQLLGCRDMSRADFIVEDDGQIWLLEVNTIPGMTQTSLYPDAARAAGIEFPELVDQLVENATNRHGKLTSAS